MNDAVTGARLQNQSISVPSCADPADVVSRLGVVQAQEFGSALWALAIRMRRATTAEALGRAFDRGAILRTHLLRPTWHFVTPSDIGWMLALSAPRVLRALSFAFRVYELDPRLRVRAATLVERALGRSSSLTRPELGDSLARAGIKLSGVRLAILTIYAELEGIACSGPRAGKQQTYALLANRAPSPNRLSLDESLAELTRRFFSTHGPATVRDYVWWSGLTVADAKKGLAMIQARSFAADGLTYWTLDGRSRRRAADRGVHLLPIYDEYVVAYRDHHAMPRPGKSRNGVLPQPVIAGGQIAATWKLAKKGSGGSLETVRVRPLTRIERRGLSKAVARYGEFLGLPLTLAEPRDA